ncbi:hypothetical protein CR513_49814, partial [Mucuna pruriens]
MLSKRKEPPMGVELPSSKRALNSLPTSLEGVPLPMNPKSRLLQIAHVTMEPSRDFLPQGMIGPDFLSNANKQMIRKEGPIVMMETWAMAQLWSEEFKRSYDQSVAFDTKSIELEKNREELDALKVEVESVKTFEELLNDL